MSLAMSSTSLTRHGRLLEMLHVPEGIVPPDASSPRHGRSRSDASLLSELTARRQGIPAGLGFFQRKWI
jgi:hypothetical protein